MLQSLYLDLLHFELIDVSLASFANSADICIKLLSELSWFSELRLLENFARIRLFASVLPFLKAI